MSNPTRVTSYKNVDALRTFLRNAGARLLDALLKHSRYRLVFHKGLLPFDYDEIYVEIESPKECSKAIEGLPELERERITRAVAFVDSEFPEDLVSANRLLLVDRTDVQLPDRDALLAELICQKDTLIDVAIGGARINDVNDFYKVRRRRLVGLLSTFNMEDPSPFEDLWEWYRKWRDEEWGTYKERIQYVSSLYDSVIQHFLRSDETIVPIREPTGWDRVVID